MFYTLDILYYFFFQSELQKKKDMYQKHAFEEYISDMISYDRSLPDWRGDWCRNTYKSDRYENSKRNCTVNRDLNFFDFFAGLI